MLSINSLYLQVPCSITYNFHHCHAAAARFPLYLYFFLSTKGDIKAFERVRLASLGVLGALVKVFLVNKIMFGFYIF